MIYNGAVPATQEKEADGLEVTEQQRRDFIDLGRRYKEEIDFLPKEKELEHKVRDLLDSHQVEGELLHIETLRKLNIYEIYSEESIEKLAIIISAMAAASSVNSNERITILEVGGGNGKLGYHLNKKLQQLATNAFDVVITDEIPPSESVSVEKIGYQAAIEKYKPTIILSSWMPYGEDWTTVFRNNPETKAYIMIGDSSCGGIDDISWQPADDFVEVDLNIGTLYGRGFVQGHVDKTFGSRVMAFVRNH
jgi:hypothetical protein